MARYVHSSGNELPPITLPSTNPVANTYTIITHAIRHPNQPLILEEYRGRHGRC